MELYLQSPILLHGVMLERRDNFKQFLLKLKASLISGQFYQWQCLHTEQNDYIDTARPGNG